MAERQRGTRRDLLIGVAALGGIAWGWQRFGPGARLSAPVPITGLPGWQRIDTTSLSTRGGNATSAAFIGIDDGSDPTSPLPADQLCPTLFKATTPPQLPLAVFSDFFCPYCRRLTARLADRAADPGAGFALNWHELPLLGPASEIAAKAAIAADLQGGYAAYQARLMATPFRPTLDFFATTAADTGLNPGRLMLDMDGQAVAQRLGQSRAAANRLGVYGTPGLVVGRTLVMGEIDDNALTRLIEDERESGEIYRLCAQA